MLIRVVNQAEGDIEIGILRNDRGRGPAMLPRHHAETVELRDVGIAREFAQNNLERAR